MSELETGIGIGRQMQAQEQRIMMLEKMMESLGKDMEEMYAVLKEKGLITEK